MPFVTIGSKTIKSPLHCAQCDVLWHDKLSPGHSYNRRLFLPHSAILQCPISLAVYQNGNSTQWLVTQNNHTVKSWSCQLHFILSYHALCESAGLLSSNTVLTFMMYLGLGDIPYKSPKVHTTIRNMKYPYHKMTI